MQKTRKHAFPSPHLGHEVKAITFSGVMGFFVRRAISVAAAVKTSCFVRRISMVISRRRLRRAFSLRVEFGFSMSAIVCGFRKQVAPCTEHLFTGIPATRHRRAALRRVPIAPWRMQRDLRRVHAVSWSRAASALPGAAQPWGMRAASWRMSAERRALRTARWRVRASRWQMRDDPLRVRVSDLCVSIESLCVSASAYERARCALARVNRVLERVSRGLARALLSVDEPFAGFAFRLGNYCPSGQATRAVSTFHLTQNLSLHSSYERSRNPPPRMPSRAATAKAWKAPPP